VPVLNVFELRNELSQVNGVAQIIRDGPLFPYRIVVGQLQFEIFLPSPFTPVLDISAEGLLVQVEIEGGNALPGLGLGGHRIGNTRYVGILPKQSDYRHEVRWLAALVTVRHGVRGLAFKIAGHGDPRS
jgi:hypothetical protein